MKKYCLSLVFMIAGLMLCNPLCAQNDIGFLPEEEIPNDLIYLPAPPANGSQEFLTDSVLYEKNKELRFGGRLAQAIADASTDTDSILTYFGPAFGFVITKENAPAIYDLVTRAKYDIRHGVDHGKKEYMRRRPFVYFDEHTPVPDEERSLRYSGSYPSGHSVRGWGIALLLAEINPERQNEILERGYQYGQSRVIIGVHFQSDVDAARLVASAVVARLHADKEFARQMKRAKREFERLSR